MHKNQLMQSLWLLLLIVAFLFVSAILPSFSIGSLTFKRVNMLADIETEPVVLPPIDTLPKADTVSAPSPVEEVPEVVIAPINPCPAGITCLEDFSANKNVLRSFFQALRNANREPIRVAFFGDSFIEGDILSASFRDTLQGIYGGQGVGYVPITSEAPQFRTTIQHAFSNWETYSLVGKQNENIQLGISGYAFVPLANNEVEYKPSKKQNYKKFDHARLFYRNRKNSNLTYTVNDTIVQTIPLTVSDSLYQLLISENNIKSVKFQFGNPDSLIVYGASFESSKGIFIDNFAMRGNSGIGLYGIEPELLRQFNQYQDYKLILLQYGLNIVTETDSMDYSWYKTKMVKVIRRLKEVFPEASIVLIGISDRAGNIDGNIKTIPAISRMRDTQRDIARNSQIAFWDLYAAMGGENSIIDYVTATPPLAAKDYTHLTFKGGKKIAKKLADAILFEQNRHDTKAPVQ
jgi:lysophospholipase L1-like esterase